MFLASNKLYVDNYFEPSGFTCYYSKKKMRYLIYSWMPSTQRYTLPIIILLYSNILIHENLGNYWNIWVNIVETINFIK